MCTNNCRARSACYVFTLKHQLWYYNAHQSYKKPPKHMRKIKITKKMHTFSGVNFQIYFFISEKVINITQFNRLHTEHRG